MIGPIDPKVLVHQGTSGGMEKNGGVPAEELTPEQQAAKQAEAEERRRHALENAWPPLDQISGLDVFTGRAAAETRRMREEASTAANGIRPSAETNGAAPVIETSSSAATQSDGNPREGTEGYV